MTLSPRRDEAGLASDTTASIGPGIDRRADSPAILAAGVTLTLGSGTAAVPVLNGIDLTVPAGQTLALLGPSGSGKSSLMAVLSGLERASGGTLTVAGERFAAPVGGPGGGALSEDALARARRGRIGIVLQAFHLLPTMSAIENVATAMELAGQGNAFDRAREELTAVGLGHRLSHYPSQLSGGEQQRVAIARALAPRPSLIFADEPTGNLDRATGAQIIELLFSRRAETGATLLLITHDAALAQRCERVLELADGRIVADRTN